MGKVLSGELQALPSPAAVAHSVRVGDTFLLFISGEEAAGRGYMGWLGGHRQGPWGDCGLGAWGKCSLSRESAAWAAPMFRKHSSVLVRRAAEERCSLHAASS